MRSRRCAPGLCHWRPSGHFGAMGKRVPSGPVAAFAARHDDQPPAGPLLSYWAVGTAGAGYRHAPVQIALEHLALLTVGLPTSLCGLGNIEPHRKPGLGG
ncbi:hypothetical protein GCM10007920_30950 [Ciceribacter naphthalenivorans]|uniref:Uncharacterized protein n=1 Tax=Sphingomonas psychrolutea TaxID=1259676 RepID=A0ABQ6EF42_9SPHN|nr:hypothetical protein GCM10007920_30950 [Ciceribacter naphthalenivorans]GLT06162.1 hypothetical protein GCM10007926_30950 [Sphingomonas psychrolutea]